MCMNLLPHAAKALCTQQTGPQARKGLPSKMPHRPYAGRTCEPRASRARSSPTPVPDPVRTVGPSATSCSRPRRSRAAAVRQSGGSKLAKAMRMWPRAPHAEPGMMHTPCARTSQAATASSSSQPGICA